MTVYSPGTYRDGRWGRVDAGALCLSSCGDDPVTSQHYTNRIATKDRHNAPAQPPHVPLSLQDGGTFFIPGFGRQNASDGEQRWGNCLIRLSKFMGPDWKIHASSLKRGLLPCRSRSPRRLPPTTAT